MFYQEFDRTFRNLDRLRRRMDRVFDEFEGAPTRALDRGEALAASRFPYVTFEDKGDKIELKGWLPGLAEKDVEIKLHQDVVTLSGERKNDAPAGYVVHRQERAEVRFSRSFSLPCKVDPEKTVATLKDGILTVSFGKAVEAQPRQIAIRAS